MDEKKYQALEYGKYLYTEGRIILLDMPNSKEWQSKLESQRTKDGHNPVFLHGQDLSGLLQKQLQESGLYSNRQETLTVFPGNGSLKPKDFLNLAEWERYAFAYAKRYWQTGKDPMVRVGQIQTVEMILPEIKNVVVVDDVISSGQTLLKLVERNAWKFPCASWTAVTWITQTPRQKSPSGVKGYDRMITTYLAEGPKGKLVPINSLSTLLETREIAESYANRHFANPWEVLAILGH